MAGYLGNIPSAVPLTSADIADGIITSAKITDGTIAIADFSATGTPSASTFLRGDNAWGSAGASAGQVIQVVSVAKTDTFFVAYTGTYTDVTGMSVSITPSSASNKILVLVSMNIGNDTNANASFSRLVRDSTAIFIGDSAGSRVRASTHTYADNLRVIPSQIMFLDSPSTTSATTYKIQAQTGGAGGGGFYLNWGADNSDNTNAARTASSITVMEIKG
jgi:hypothetical protein